MAVVFQHLLAKLEVKKSPSSFAPPGTHWSNRDLDPVPPQKRTWTMFNFCTYWLSDAFSVATWEISGTILAIGLSWRDAIPIILVGYFITMIFIVLNGITGARLHIPFAVLNRSSMGFGLAYWSIFSRAILACFWLGVQGANGGDCMTQMLRAIWPSYRNIPNHLPTSAGITTQGMISYFLFWIIQLPILLLRPSKLRYFFLAKANLVIVPICAFAILIWAFVTTGGGPIFAQRETIRGSARSWAWLHSVIGNYATLAVKYISCYKISQAPRVKSFHSIADFTRYARRPSDTYIQIIIIPVMFTLIGFMGIAATSAGDVLYGGLFWNPLQLIDHWESRVATFFVAFSFTIATMGTNISANSLSAANDFSALFPRYVNIQRGSFLCAVIGGWLCVPWLVLANATSFLTFMSGYTVFIAPIIGIMVSDYWILHKCKVDVPSMYQPHGRYWYTYGINWRALIAMVLTVPPMLPGLAQAITPSVLAGGTAHLYDISFLFGCFGGAAVYLFLSFFSPAKETFIEDKISPSDDNLVEDNQTQPEKKVSEDDGIKSDT